MSPLSNDDFAPFIAAVGAVLLAGVAVLVGLATGWLDRGDRDDDDPDPGGGAT